MLTPSTRQGSWPTARGIRSIASCSPPASRRRPPASSPRERWGYDVTGRGGVTLTEKWAGGMSTLHGLMSSGFPNLFMMPGRYEQSSVVVNFVYTLTENAKHLAYIASAVRERGARLFDVAQDAEQAWVKRIVEGSPLDLEFLEACTPGRNNREGRPAAIPPQNLNYPGGPVKLFDLLEEWRADQRLAGISSGIGEGRRPMEIVEIVPGFVAEVKEVDLRRGGRHRLRGCRDGDPGPVAGRRLSGPGRRRRPAAELHRQPRAAAEGGRSTLHRDRRQRERRRDADRRGGPAPVRRRGSRVWHTDLSFRRLPDRYTVLSSRVLPRSGGHTQFCDTYASYAALEDALKDRVDQLVAVHDLRYSRQLLGLGLLDTEQKRDFVTAQPLVLQNPRTGRKSLYLARHIASIVGMADDEAQELVAYLLDLATQPQFVFELDWGGPGTLAVWDNRATMHRGTPYNDTSEKRIMRRSAVVAPGVV